MGDERVSSPGLGESTPVAFQRHQQFHDDGLRRPPDAGVVWEASRLGPPDVRMISATISHCPLPREGEPQDAGLDVAIGNRRNATQSMDRAQVAPVHIGDERGDGAHPRSVTG